jgi:serine-type D-Ala-D-Ala carboxypeptidase/endopeptidase (penicillin-binding protein 4)
MLNNFYNIRRKLFVLLILILFVSSSASANDKQKLRLNEFRDKIEKIIADVDCELSVKIVSTVKNDLLFDYKADLKMIPASITKVITATTALYVLGSGYQFKTAVYTDDVNISDGIINGNVYIKGYGDPDLSSSDILELVKQVTAKKITEITGNIIYDETYFDDKHYGLANYYQSDTKLQYWPYLSALNFNKNKAYNDPPQSAGQYFFDEVSKNIKVDGIVISGYTPEAAKEIAIFTRAISETLANMNKPSDNQSALCVYKTIGANYDSPPGTMQKGTNAVIDFLTTIGIKRSSFEFVEGSGLSRYNMVTADLYITLLKYMFDDEKTFDIFYNSLSVAGIDGTLKKRMVDTEAEKNVHAKTGTINNVSTLTGYAVSRDNELISFYIAMNGFSGNAKFYRDKQDEICEAICQFSR